MDMKTFSERTGLSPHTLRYYEKIGLLKQIQRDQSGRRIYTVKALSWVTFILRLKNTGMPLADIQLYAQMREKGDSTLRERQTLLQAHQHKLIQQIAEQQTHLTALNEKIALYDDLIQSDSNHLTSTEK
ncbi:MerR family transcriptional regulator [Thaumasiovibrio subtropicus]|uniref:MerR family transcriptional regulator n=1 Tax=Thaumasiovibrio subtropicus TaxID=1891207 RepID=UPI000B35F140|nr:MerR family transcriptional regulator [Thaumasiovibrio subtropicus]